MLRLSKHLVKNWRRRVGKTPSQKAVNKLIREAVRIQKGKRMVTRFSVLKTLSIYWHVDKEIIITVDRYNKTVVSVYSRVNMAGNQQFGIGGCLEQY